MFIDLLGDILWIPLFVLKIVKGLTPRSVGAMNQTPQDAVCLCYSPEQSREKIFSGSKNGSVFLKMYRHIAQKTAVFDAVKKSHNFYLQF